MAEESVNLERTGGLAQHADGATVSSAPGRSGTGPTTPIQQGATPFVRYWQQPAANKPSSQYPNTVKTKPLPQPINGESVQASMDMSIFQSPISSTAVTTIELMKVEESEDIVELQSSDDDEVVEVALPPKPTITIESSDDDDEVTVTCGVTSTPQNTNMPEVTSVEIKKDKKRQKSRKRAVSASPVPSVVSSISDDFIRGDCVAFNITRQPEEHNFDFNLHGTDLLDDESNNSLSQKSKKKKNKQKNKEKTPMATPPPVANVMNPQSVPSPQVVTEDQCFTTPKSKAKRKNDKIKNYSVSERSIPDPDIYESDSNQSALVENVLETITPDTISSQTTELIPEKATVDQPSVDSVTQLVDLTSVDSHTRDKGSVPVEDNLVMGNVTGIEPVVSLTPRSRQPPYGNSLQGSLRTSSRHPQNVREQLEMRVFDCVAPQLSRSSCRKDMERFYNESWGGEDFDHYEILRSMSRDKNLWTIDPRDRMPSGPSKRRCHHCNQVGHGYERCWMKPRICHMCGAEGHMEPRCPNRMCLKCGTPNSIFSMSCRNCATWNRVYCAICENYGHPMKDCPDLWRRYHSTVENDGILIIQDGIKRKDELFCSGCTRRGHLAHVCYSIPYSGLPLHSPFVFQYKPVYPPTHPTHTVSASGRYFTLNEGADGSGFRNYIPETPKANQNTQDTPPSKVSQKRLSTSNTPETSKKRNLSNSENAGQKDASQKNYVSDVTSSMDKNNQVLLQDCEVSNSSDIVTTVKIYIEKIVMEELCQRNGSDWLAVVSAQNRVEVTLEERPTTFMNVKGMPADQEAFQVELKDWASKLQATKENPGPNKEQAVTDVNNFCKDIPHKKHSLLRMLNRAFAVLRSDLGDPKAIYKELQFTENNHRKLLKHKSISHKKLSNSRTKINEILKNLNMILVGQAGLVDGSEHLKELFSLHKSLSKLRKQQLPYELRNKIGEHYHYVFSSVARKDYAVLMAKYYNKNVSNNQATDLEVLPYKSPKKKLKKLRRKKNKAEATLANSKNTNDTNTTPPPDTNNQQPSQSKEYTIDQIQSYQKKLRKWNVGNDENQQRQRMLLNRLRKFQVQVKGRGLFQKQYIQLDKLMSDVKNFFGEP